MTIMGLVKTRRLAAMQKQQRAKAGMKPPTQRYSQMEKRSRKDKKEFMRSLALLLAVLAGSAFARTVVVPPQPMSPYADTEVSTNIPFSVSSEHAREIEMRFALDGCMSNCVQVAFGKDADGSLVLADEVLTPDSSRFWPQASYAVGANPPSLDKQYVRDWLDSIHFNHQPPGPVLPDDVVARTREIYVKAYEELSGKKLV